LALVYSDSLWAKNVRCKIAAQFGAVGCCTNLKTVIIFVDLRALPEQDHLERPLSVFQANLRSVVALAGQAALVLHVTGARLSDKRTITEECELPSVLACIFQAFRDRHLSELRLHGLSIKPKAAAGFEPVIAGLDLIASGLRSLHLTGITCLILSQPPITLETLEELSIVSVPTPAEARSFLARLPQFINANSSSLIRLQLDFPSMLAAYVGNPVPAGIVCEKLVTLAMYGSALQSIGSAFSLPSCTTLSVTVNSSADCKSLHTLLAKRPRCVPELRSLRMRTTQRYHMYPSDRELYERVQDLVDATAADMVLEAQFGPAQACKQSELLSWLDLFCQDLHHWDVHFNPSPKERIMPRTTSYRTHLPNLRSWCIRVAETTISGDMSAHWLVNDCLDRIAAPVLQRLELHVSTPYANYLNGLAKAIEQGAFPQLKTISGVYSLYDDAEEWTSAVTACRRTSFVQACTRKGINISDLRWATKTISDRR
jgi:hypothetical protein